MIIDLINQGLKTKKKLFALLIDPDKHTEPSLHETLNIANQNPGPAIILVGGSLLFNHIEETVDFIKQNTQIPVVLFPGNSVHVTPKADAILLLSLISGRNPDFLIGQHVIAAPALRRSKIEVIPTGYILIDSGIETSVQYMSNTLPIPRSKNDIAIATAMAGEMLGLKVIYLEAGSGALNPVPPSMIKAVKKETKVPLIVGGGLNSVTLVEDALINGADMVVIGTAIEKNTRFIGDVARLIARLNH
jgi:putative glycerol-1-phosphate prenyltransferase